MHNCGEFNSLISRPAGGQATEPVEIATPCKALSFIWQALLKPPDAPQPRPMKFILPPEDGYIVRNDFVEEMMRGCQLTPEARGFISPRQHCASAHPARTDGSASNLLHLLQRSVGVVVANDGSALKLLKDELVNRISWPWLVPTPIEPTRIVVIGEKRERRFCERFYDAAKACGVSVIVMDKPGHWLQDPAGKGASYREDFVPFTGFTFDDLPERIVQAIRRLPYQVDGIMTTMDPLLSGVASAAEMLGLPAAPAESYRRATDKYETRRLQKTATTLTVASLEDLASHLESLPEPLRYPLIVKPTRSHGSFGVSRVENESELVDAVRHALSSAADQHILFGLQTSDAKAIVETYCEGPEVDVNFVLWNGELLFSEVVDNFPCSGDSALTSSKTEQFVETGSAWPSGLPQDENNMLRTDLLKIVRQLGFHSGVIHVEAKVQNSAVDWHMDDDGVLDLQARAGATAHGASSFLLEVNPRPPGHTDSMGSAYVNGVDYYALHIMHAIGDEARFCSLAGGFRVGPQYHYATSPLPIHSATGGRMPCDLNLEDYGLAKDTVMLRPFFKAGDTVPSPEDLRFPWLGFVMLCSTTSRRDLLEKVAIARDKIVVKLEQV